LIDCTNITNDDDDGDDGGGGVDGKREATTTEAHRQKPITKREATSIPSRFV